MTGRSTLPPAERLAWLRLIRNVATMVEGVDDILRELGP